jgi:hypothetical protein
LFKCLVVSVPEVRVRFPAVPDPPLSLVMIIEELFKEIAAPV